MEFGEKAIRFYQSIRPPDIPLPDGIRVLDPFSQKNVPEFLETFYRKYYGDTRERIFLIGINPGRFGGGITGIPFTDPVNLQEALGIRNDLDRRHELSSRFIYDVVAAMGGPDRFFGRCYLTAMSPFGFTRDHKNLNYYDDAGLLRAWSPYMIRWLGQQLDFGAYRAVAYSLGQGRNLEYLIRMNEENGFFDRIVSLPHPRWVMQYRYKKRADFLQIYIDELGSLQIS